MSQQSREILSVVRLRWTLRFQATCFGATVIPFCWKHTDCISLCSFGFYIYIYIVNHLHVILISSSLMIQLAQAGQVLLFFTFPTLCVFFPFARVFANLSFSHFNRELISKDLPPSCRLTHIYKACCFLLVRTRMIHGCTLPTHYQSQQLKCIDSSFS